MSGIAEASDNVRRAIVYAIALYFAVLLYARVANDETAYLVSEALFGLVALGVGGLLVWIAAGRRTPLLAAGVCLIAGGIAQFGVLVTAQFAFSLVAQAAVFLGVGIYVYAVWIDG